jgi:AraC family transcriptional regulator
VTATRAQALVPLPDGVLSVQSVTQTWNGVKVDSTAFRCSGERTLVPPLFTNRARLTITLEEMGGTCEPRFAPGRPCASAHQRRHMSLLPVDVPVWGYIDRLRFVRDVVLTFDPQTLPERLGQGTGGVGRTPLLRFANERLWALGQALASECHSPGPMSSLYGDSLVLAVFIGLMRQQSQGSELQRPGGLALWQLRRAIDYLETHVSEHVSLQELSALVGLSQFHFSRAFKASTGMPPHRFQLEARIRRAKALLSERTLGLVDIALAVGFSDQAHFTRSFRLATGLTPHAWRRQSWR